MRFALSAVAEERDEPSNKLRKHQSLVLFLRDAAVAVVFVALVLIAMFAYTGLWPPMVVVESNSMMHGDENLSHIGTIDTGDLVLVKKVDSPSDVTTYMDGLVSGHKTYGDYGDVVIYKRAGSDIGTPIIHRALIYLEINSDGKSYRAESLRQAPADKWSVSDPGDTWDRLASTLTIEHVGYDDLTVTIDTGGLLTSQRSGFITKGDHNFGIDQMSGSSGPVDISWVVGKARGEIPWFGLLKLWSTGTLGSPAPDNSVRDLWISLAIIVMAPIIIDVILTFKEKHGISKRKAKTRAEGGAPILDEEKKAEAENPETPSGQPPGQL